MAIDCLDRAGTYRRLVLKGLAAAPFVLGLSRASMAAACASRSLVFHHLHTGERLSVTYFADGDYVEESLRQVDRVLRDFRTGEVHAIDRQLLRHFARARARMP